MALQEFYTRIWAIAGAVSVRTKILGIVLGLVLVLGVGYTLQVRTLLTATMDGLLEEQSISVTRDLAARSTDLILLNDLFALHQLLLNTKSNNANFRYAFILDSQGRVLAHTFGSGFPQDLLAINSVSPNEHHRAVVIQTNEGLVWDTAVPILEGRGGTARVGLSDTAVRVAVQSVTGQLALTTFLVSVLGITAATLLTWILTRPILELVSATENVAKGNFSPQVRRWAEDEIGDLAEAFNQMTAELARTEELRQERENLRKQLLEKVIFTQEEERRRIARELHDSASQSMTSLLVGIKTMDSACNNSQVHAHAQDLRQLAGQVLDDMHNLAIQLRPTVLDDLGLSAALERLVRDWQKRTHITVDTTVHQGSQRLPEVIETALYRIVQEALTNVARHAEARSVSILIERRQDIVVAVIEDDGQGFDVEQVHGQGRLGLLGVRERAELLGGRMTIESTPGHGASLFIQLPIQETNGRPK